MKTVRLLVDFTYDDDLFHGDNKDEQRWFYYDVLFGEAFILHSNEVGDEIGTLRVVSEAAKEASNVRPE